MDYSRPDFFSSIAFVVLCAMTVGVPLTSDDSTCYSTSTSPYRYYSTYTNYDDVQTNGTDFYLPGHNYENRITRLETLFSCYKGCEATKFYYLSRHGIRYPTAVDAVQPSRLSRIHNLAVENMSKGSMCEADQTAIKNWMYRMDPGQAGQLADNGRQQSLEAGRRWSQRFPTLVGKPYSSSRYDFKHTYVPRTYDTAKALAMGMFNRSDFDMDYVSPPQCDSSLLYYSCCEKYNKAFQGQSTDEWKKFVGGHVISDVVINISHRLGLNSTGLSFDDMHAAYATCAFEHSIFGTSPWCAAFSDEDLEVAEYLLDLLFYYNFGYSRGQSVMYEQTCDLVKDFIGYFKNASTSVTGKIRVAHDITLTTLFTRLGVFKDTVKPTASNMEQQSHRQWRSSLFTGFGANIAFVEYKCGSEYKIRVFQNESPLALPMCSASGCKKSDIMNSVLGTFANSCSFSKICDVDVPIIG